MEGLVGLPDRLFARDRYPVGRVNVYSRPDLLAFVHAQLNGTEAWDEIRSSSFGRLFNLPVTRCYISCKLLHSLLSRQLVTKRRYELWTLFGSNPLRFSLTEFQGVTGLNCAMFPKSYVPDSNSQTTFDEGSPWHTYIGPNKEARISDLMDLLRDSEGMETWRRTGLALLLIVEGVIVASHQGNKRLTPKYVDMLGNRDAFMNFPWGRESFLKTISSMIPSRMSVGGNDSCVSIMLKQLKQVSMSLKGFPLALQLLAFNAIPDLEDRIPNYYDMRTVMEVDFDAPANNAALTLNAFLEVENNPEVSVFTPFQGYGRNVGETIWFDEVVDERVVLLEEYILRGHVFRDIDWKGGDMSQQIIKRPIVGISMGCDSDSPVKVKGGKVLKGTMRARAYLTRSCKAVGEVKKRNVCDDGEDFCISGGNSNDGGNIGLGAGACVIPLAKRFRKGKSVDFGALPPMPDEVGVNIKEWMESCLEQLNSSWAQKFDKLKSRLKRCKHTRSRSRTHVSTRLSKMSTHNFKKTKCDGVGTSLERPCDGLEKTMAPSNKQDGSYARGDGHMLTPIQFKETDHCVLVGDPCAEVIVDEAIEAIGSHSGESGSALTTKPLNQSQVLVKDIVPYCKVAYCWYKYTPLPEVHNGEVIYCDKYGVLHTDRHKRDIVGLEDVIDLGNIIKKLKIENVCNDGDNSGGLSLCIKEADLQDRNDSEGSGIVTGLVRVRSPPRFFGRGRTSVMEEFCDYGLFARYSCFPYPVFQKLDRQKYDSLQKYLSAEPSRRHITKCNFEFDNSFLLTLSKPKEWVNTLHMEILMDMFGKHHAETLAWTRAVFITPLLVNYILSDQRKFEMCRDKRAFEWSPRIKKVVSKPGYEWLEDVDLLYMPVIWGNRHWAGLVINLRSCSIQVLDPDVDLTREEKVQQHLGFVATALPYIMKQCCIMKHSSRIDLQPFNVVRLTGLYKNKRSGDCGPVSAKFLELHLYGDLQFSRGKLTDGMVDDLRRQYMMDIYGLYVLPDNVRF